MSADKHLKIKDHETRHTKNTDQESIIFVAVQYTRDEGAVNKESR
jgi:hypothetical protein